MIAFHVYLNGKKVSTAGVGNLGVLHMGVAWVRREGKNTRSKKPGSVEEELSFHVGGLISTTGEHLIWQEAKSLRIGDEVKVRIIEAEKVDKPAARKTPDLALGLRAQKKYVRKMAKQFGWKIVMPK